MSPYGIVTGDFWTGPTGKAIRAAGGKDAQILALYLMSAHHATMIGLYRLSFHAIVEESGLTDEEVTIGFAALEHVHFASFDTETEHVWVREMAKYRLNLTGAPLAKKDKRLVGAQRLFDSLLPNPYLIPFFERYRIELRLTRPPKSRLLPLQRGFEGASKPLGSPNKHRTEEGASKGLARGFEGASAIGATSTRIKGSSGSEDLSSTYRDQKVQPGVVEGIGDPARARTPQAEFSSTSRKPENPIGFAPPNRAKPPRGHEHCHPPCDRICVPAALHAEFIARCGMEPAAAARLLDEFYASVRAAIPPGPFGDDRFEFWKKHLAVRFGTIAPQATPSFGVSKKTANNPASLQQFLSRES